MASERGYLQVRAEIDVTVDRHAFELWYEAIHIPQVIDRLRATTACRMWSLESPNVHYAVYEFDTPELLLERVASADMKDLIADFDLTWGGHVTRYRTSMRSAQPATSSDA